MFIQYNYGISTRYSAALNLLNLLHTAILNLVQLYPPPGDSRSTAVYRALRPRYLARYLGTKFLKPNGRTGPTLKTTSM
eukprot:SAG31_NODE_458_length_15415_cov_3.647428_5_plen_79_part_00